MTPDDTVALTIEVSSLGPEAWNRVLAGFSDASVYQSLAYAESRGTAESVEHLVVRRGDHPVAAAQVEIVKAPLPRLAVARVFWGPVWNRSGWPGVEAHLRAALDALRREYVTSRRMLLRVVPRELSTWTLLPELEGAGWKRRPGAYRTVLLDLPATVDELRPGLHQNWRRNLIKGEKAGLRVVAGTDDRAFDTFMGLYAEMRSRKGFEVTLDPAPFRVVQERLPRQWKPMIFTAFKEAVPVAAVICSLQGDTGVYLFGASADAALPLRASYVTHWRAMEWLIRAGAKRYDLGGASRENAGTYQFKTGTGGRYVEFVGELELSASFAARAGVRLAEAVKRRAHQFRALPGRDAGAHPGR